MTGCARSGDPFVCPDKWTLFQSITALLPRGRAWQSHEDVLEISPPGGEVWPPDNPWGARLTVMQQFWAAAAEVLAYLHERACALVQEFFCSTLLETRDAWETEFGFPDACEVYDSVCEKVTAVAGVTCAYYAQIASRRGWAITCWDCTTVRQGYGLGCGWRLGDGHRAGCGRCDTDAIYFIVNTSASPAYVRLAKSRLGCGWRLGGGRKLGCDPSFAPLRCLIERIKPAHVKTVYLII